MFKIQIKNQYRNIFVFEPNDSFEPNSYEQKHFNFIRKSAFSVYRINSYIPFKCELIKHKFNSVVLEINNDLTIENFTVFTKFVASDYCYIKTKNFSKRDIVELLYLLKNILQKKGQFDLAKTVLKSINVDYYKYINNELTDHEYFFP